eukprot:CAMPEP_0179077382 /NCGR_PEP_ID=MMETSP0796-20121207/34586_1 /TAXON_ID=73915 /ORGANISM="Pyrodinium bahamense, Strain pbaha01" /LENGTH=99 /DNA_ID=CAMNT_0020774661 /DNA_START=283 /DNA_END=580 /DNA_ORIENTATION=+
MNRRPRLPAPVEAWSGATPNPLATLWAGAAASTAAFAISSPALKELAEVAAVQLQWAAAGRARRRASVLATALDPLGEASGVAVVVAARLAGAAHGCIA